MLGHTKPIDMKFTRLMLFLLLFAGIVPMVFSQNVQPSPFIKETNILRDQVNYPHLREADVTWSKRVWRKLDLREKMNHKFYFPTEEINDRRSLVQVLIQSVDEGSLAAFDPLDDEFATILTQAQIDQKLTYVDTFWMPSDLPPYDPIPTVVEEPFDYSRVKEIRIKEEWYFDKQQSVMGVRIIGIQPVMENIDRTTGQVRGKEPMFWVYFPEARRIFATTDVFNRHNDAQRWTLDDVFWKRMFGSYIYKVGNVYNRQIADYALNGIDQILEAERLKDDVFAMEHDLWEY